jgi:hypothetical protein
MTEESKGLHATFIDNDWINAGKVYDCAMLSWKRVSG